MIDYEEEYIFPLILKREGSVTLRSCMFAVPAALLALFIVWCEEINPDIREQLGLPQTYKSQMWSATTAVIGILLGFRTKQALSRFWEGTGLLHQMRGEWFDSVSCCVTFSRAAVKDKPQEVEAFRHTIVRLMSLCHGSALEEIAGDHCDRLETIDAFGLDTMTLVHLKNCKEVHEFNRVEVLLHLTQSLITKSLDDGILKIPPPILSRVYQTLSRGFVNLLNAKKITDTRFPFPYAQLITMLLFFHLLLTPLQMGIHFESKIWAPIFTFVPVFGMFSLNFIASELENPFGNDDNDLPLAHFQSEMNTCLLMLLQDNADLIPGLSSRCILDFETLKGSLRPSRLSGLNGVKPGRGSISYFQADLSDGKEAPQRNSSSSARSVGTSIGRSSSARSSLGTNLEVASIEEKKIQEEQAKRAEADKKAADAKLPVANGSEAADAKLPVANGSEAPLAPAKVQDFSGGLPEPQVEAPIALIFNTAQQTQRVNHEAGQGVSEAPTERVGQQERLDEFDKALRNWTKLIDRPRSTVQALSKSMDSFNVALQNWTQLIEEQVSELSLNFLEMKHFSEAIPALVGTTQRPIQSDHGSQDEDKMLLSLKPFSAV